MPFGKNNRGVIIREDLNQVLGALGSGTGILVAGGKVAITEDFRLMKSHIYAIIHGLTAGEGIHSLLLGIANADLSLAEIEEALELNGPQQKSDRIETEKAERYVEIIGRFVGDDVGTTRLHLDRKFKAKWSFMSDEGWVFFVYNQDGAALTTGATVRIKCKHFGVWLI